MLSQVMQPKRALYAALLLGTSLTFCFPGSASAQSYSSPQGYSLQLPSGWQIEHHLAPLPGATPQKADIVLAHPPHSLPMLRVDVEPHANCTLAQGRSLIVASLERMFPNYKLCEQRTRDFAGTSAIETAGGFYSHGVSIAVDTLFVIKNERDYVIDFCMSPTQFASSYKTFLSLQKGFHWIALPTQNK